MVPKIAGCSVMSKAHKYQWMAHDLAKVFDNGKGEYLGEPGWGYLGPASI